MYMLSKRIAAREGFTLVELIVVIAILGILAGVAVPVYSGYIDKAGEAADLQLLGAVNTAFSAACAEMGVDPTGIAGVATLEGSTGNMLLTDIAPSGIKDSFFTFFGENANQPFKVYTSLGYDRFNGVFVDGSKTVTAYYNGQPVTVTMAEITAYNASCFAALGSETVLNQVDKVVDAASATLAQMSNPQTYPQFTQGFVSFLKDRYGMTEEEIYAMSGTERANALVMMVASKAKDLDVQGTIDAFNSGSSTLDLQGMIEGGNATIDMATQMTVPFALAMAYVNSDQSGLVHTGKYKNQFFDNEADALAAANALNENPANTVQLMTSGRNAGKYRFRSDAMSAYDFFYNGAAVQWESSGDGGVSITIGGTLNGANNLQNTNDVNDMVTIISDSDDFKQYMQSTQAVADLQGFVSAMTMLDNNADIVSTTNLLQNGFGDNDLQAMIAAILGN